MDSREPIRLTKGTPGQPCPIAKTLDVIGTKWTFLILNSSLIYMKKRNNQYGTSP